jgi:hypothetical protein
MPQVTFLNMAVGRVIFGKSVLTLGRTHLRDTVKNA